MKGCLCEKSVGKLCYTVKAGESLKSQIAQITARMHLPDDVMLDICVRLPVKSVGRI
ncbi:hypothetical protein MKX03_026167, partial [Papaver bracteatum]